MGRTEFEIGYALGTGVSSTISRGIADWRSIQLDRQNRKEFDGAMALAAERRGMIASAGAIEEAEQLEQWKQQVQRSPGAQEASRPTGNVLEDGTPETEDVIRTPEGDIPIAQVLQLKMRKQQADSQRELAEVDLIMELQSRYPTNPYVKQWAASTYAGIQQKQQIRAKQVEAQRLQLDTIGAQLERQKFEQEKLKYAEEPQRETQKKATETAFDMQRDAARIEAERRAEISVDKAKPAEGPKEGDIAGMRKEYGGLSQDFVKVRDAYSRIQSIAQDSSPAGDVALIFSFIRILDPGSTVREGEFATAEQTRGVPETVVQQYNKALKGERLSPGQRQDFIRQSGNLYAAQERNQKKLEGQFRSLAQRRGMNPDDVVLDIGAAEAPAAPPAAGGGTPEDINSLLEKYR